MKQSWLVILLAFGNLCSLPGQTIKPHSTSAEKGLVRHRLRIDDLDRKILSLLNERAAIALEIGRIRQREGTPPSSAQSRQEEVLRNAMKNCRPPLSPEAARRIYERIIAEMIAIQALDSGKEQ